MLAKETEKEKDAPKAREVVYLLLDLVRQSWRSRERERERERERTWLTNCARMGVSWVWLGCQGYFPGGDDLFGGAVFTCCLSVCLSVAVCGGVSVSDTGHAGVLLSLLLAARHLQRCLPQAAGKWVEQGVGPAVVCLDLVII